MSNKKGKHLPGCLVYRDRGLKTFSLSDANAVAVPPNVFDRAVLNVVWEELRGDRIGGVVPAREIP